MLRRATVIAVRSSRRPLSTQSFRYQALQTEAAAAVPAVVPTKYAQAYDKDFNDADLKDAPVPLAVRAIYHAPLKVPAQYNIPACDLQIRSYTVKNVEFFCDFALRAAYYLRLPAFGPVPLPRRTERWTVPKSNFVHKKAQQNFERITYKRLIQIKDADPEVVQVWLAFLRKHEYHGIGMKANVYTFEKLGAGSHMAKKLEEIKKKGAEGADHNQQLTAIRKAFDASHNLPDAKPKAAPRKAKKNVTVDESKKPQTVLDKSETKLESVKKELKGIRSKLTSKDTGKVKIDWNASPFRARKAWIQTLESAEARVKEATVTMDSILGDLNQQYGKNWRTRTDLSPKQRQFRNRLFSTEATLADSFKEIKGVWKTLHTQFGDKWGSRVTAERPMEKLWKDRVEAKHSPAKSEPKETVSSATPTIQQINSKSQASSGHPEEHMPRELEEAQEETKDISTSPSEASSGHPEDHLPREMEEAQEEQKPIENAPSPRQTESKPEESSKAMKEEPAVDLTAGHHPEPTTSEDDVAADRLNADLSHPDPLDTRTAKDIQVEVPQAEASPKEAEDTTPQQKQQDSTTPPPPQPTESESVVAADSEFVPPPSQEGAKQEAPNAKEIQVEEATKKDN